MDQLRQDYTATRSSAERFGIAGADRIAHEQLRTLYWEDTLQRLAGKWKISLEQLPAPFSAAEKVKLAAAMKATTSVSNGWLAGRLNMGQPASVSQFVRRFHLAGGAKSAEFRKLVSRVKS